MKSQRNIRSSWILQSHPPKAPKQSRPLRLINPWEGTGCWWSFIKDAAVFWQVPYLRFLIQFYPTGLFLTHGTILRLFLFPKKDTDLMNPNAYSPISRLNKDLKFFTSILANWVGAIIGQCIDPDLSGFIPHRDMADNTI